MFVVGASDWAYVLGAVSVPLVTGVFGVIIWKLNGVYREVRSPNGASTGSLNYDAWKTSMDLREQLAEVREAQLEHKIKHAEDVANERKLQQRLEKKVDLIAETQQKHEVRFANLFNHLDLVDPTIGGKKDE